MSTCLKGCDGQHYYEAYVFILQKETPLANAVFWAARKGNLALLQLLLNSGRVDVDCRDSNGTTALMVASFSAHYDCARELIMQGADINLQRKTGSTALFFASQQGHNEIVKLLFEFGASTELQTKDGGTALSVACQCGHSKVVETLLKNGANVHDQLHDGATPLFLASQGGHVTVIRHLLSSGAKVNHSREDGTAPIWMAAQMGHDDVVKVLLLRGADRDAYRNDGSTALFKSAFKGHNNVIEELLKFSPSLDLLKNGSTVLHAAVTGGNPSSVSLLLRANADPTLPNKDNKLPADLTKSEDILMALHQKSLNAGTANPETLRCRRISETPCSVSNPALGSSVALGITAPPGP
ncbi:ankyrin repeat domain-containing protein 29 [Osmerus mordax]|uniref:ankyrin repeat domain-containing protein 29 n=1 Tax=Osmerus mordax TaxID=8014 RepID=UPI00350FA52F